MVSLVVRVVVLAMILVTLLESCGEKLLSISGELFPNDIRVDIRVDVDIGIDVVTYSIS